jgi:hypothetical protein
MGAGRWTIDSYSAAARFRAATGTSAFAYSDGGASTTHPALDPKGVVVRESRDSDEHPESLAIAVLFDVTGSMRDVPRALQERLPALLGLLLRKGYVEHPQILFGAIGDATCDRAPLQIGQFESDNRMDDQLGQILLEGGGGGQMTESYELAAYFMARHTAIDCWEKRGHKGYLFIIGDEMPYPAVDPRLVHGVIGDAAYREPARTEAIFAELRRRWEVFYILPEGSSYVGDRRVLGAWRTLLGEHVISLADLDAVCETIALAIGLREGAVDLADGLADLADVGSGAGGVVSRALAPLGAVTPTAVAAATLPAGLADGVDTVARL